MSGMHQAMLMGGAAGPVGELSSTAQAFPGSDFTTTSLTYVDLLNGSGGSVISVNVTVDPGAVVWIHAGMTANNGGANAGFYLGVNDGSTTHDVAGGWSSSFVNRLITGNILIAGLSGSKTFTLKVRATSAGTIRFGADHAAFLRVTTVITKNVQVQSRPNVNTLTISGTSAFFDLLDQTAGNTYAVSLTKGTGTNVLCIGMAPSVSTNVANATQELGVNDGTTDWRLGINRTFSSGVERVAVVGAQLLTGLSAGTYTLKLRAKSSSNTQWQESTSGRNISSIACIETGTGHYNATAVTVNPASNVAISATSYTNVLDASAGSPITRTITKASGATTDLVVFGAIAGVGAGSHIFTLGCNDGTSDYDLGRCQIGTRHGNIGGECRITGLAAGSYTITLRGKVSTSTFTLGTGINTASLAVIEVPHAP